ncbi:MAG: CotH kinase family protein [Bacteroidales bacterium]
MKNLLSIITFILLSFNLFGQITINEVCKNNSTTIKDEDKEASSWIEIYNYGKEKVKLENYYLSDDQYNPLKWQLPKIEINPESFEVIFCSKKNRRASVNHWINPVTSQSSWLYFTTKKEIDSDWMTPSYKPDHKWKTGKMPIGYGDNNDITIVEDDKNVFARFEFQVSDTANIQCALLHMDYDDATVVYINGIDVYRKDLKHSGKPIVPAQQARAEKEPRLINNLPPLTQMLNQEKAKSVLKKGKNLIAIQVHDNDLNNKENDLSAAFWLSIGYSEKNTEENTIIKNFPYFQPEFHTNFKLGASDNQVILSSKDLSFQETFKVDSTGLDESIIRWTDGQKQIWKTKEATPKSSNNLASVFLNYSNSTVEPSINSGFYDSAIDLLLKSSNEKDIIHFTLDGSEPNISSKIFSKPLNIDKTTVVKVKCYGKNNAPGKTFCYTYIIGEKHDLPTVVISTNPELLFDPITGIYVLGPEGQNWETAKYFANFWKDIEIPVHFDYFDALGKHKFNTKVGAKIHGNWSRALPQKSFRLAKRAKYGNSNLNYPFFEDDNDYNFEDLVIRNSGNDFRLAHIRDVYTQNIILNHSTLDAQKAQAVASYINEEYWGLQYIREKVNVAFLEKHHAVDREKICLLEKNGTVIKGSNKEYIKLIEYVRNHKLENQTEYKYISDRIDISNLIDYSIFQLFFLNSDWPRNNLKLWKAPNTKWKFIPYDLDVTLGYFKTHTYFDQFELLKNNECDFSHLLNKLLKNPSFSRHFILRYTDLLNTALCSDSLKNNLFSLKKKIENEMLKHRERWKDQEISFNWKYDIERIEYFIKYGPSYVFANLKDKFILDEAKDINIITKDNGYIQVNSLIIDKKNWKGKYFRSIPLTFNALPKKGFIFSHWTLNGKKFDKSEHKELEIQFKENDTLEVFFSKDLKKAPPIYFSEICFNQVKDHNCGDWIELLNISKEDYNISNWRIKSASKETYTIPENTILKPNQRLIIAWNKDLFNSFYDCNHVIEDKNLKIEVNNTLYLNDPNNNIIRKITLKEESPWFIDKNTKGRTLIADKFEGYQDQAENWKYGCFGGNPGKEKGKCLKNPDLRISEICFDNIKALQSKDWVELYNNEEKNINNFSFYFSDDEDKLKCKVTIEELKSKQRIVLCQDTSSFHKYFPDIPIHHSPFLFGLNKNGETLYLKDKFKQTFSKVHYLKDDTWPVFSEEDKGKTLEAISDYTNDKEETNWFFSCYGGTPSSPPENCSYSKDLIITNVFYNTKNDFGQWIILYNISDRELDLSNHRIEINNEFFTFKKGLKLSGKNYTILANQAKKLKSKYPYIYDIISLDFELGEENEIKIYSNKYFNTYTLNHTNTFPWPDSLSFYNSSMELKKPYKNMEDPANWKRGKSEIFYVNIDPIKQNSESRINFKILPNPNSGSFTINLSQIKEQEYNYTIYSLDGRIQQRGNLRSQNIYFSKKGIYILEVNDDNYCYGRTKLVVY